MAVAPAAGDGLAEDGEGDGEAEDVGEAVVLREEAELADGRDDAEAWAERVDVDLVKCE